MNKPLWPKGKVLIEGVGYFKDGEVPKWAYVTQKLMAVGMVLISIGIMAIWITLLFFN